MKKLLIVLFFIVQQKVFAQNTYWQQQVNYNIDVKLNDREKSLSGSESIMYKNNSPDTLSYIWFHIYPNAYKNEQTALFQQIKNDDSRKKKLKNYTYGHIEGLNFKVDNTTAIIESHPNSQYIDVIKLNLPKALFPGDSIHIQTDFKVFLPSYFSRSGYADGEFMATQWYPKPAVYDKDGWHEFPYLDMGEFYSDYGNYNVNITLPSDYVVGATGSLQTEDELSIYKNIGSYNYTNRLSKPKLYTPQSGKQEKTLHYKMNHVVDFAWFADKDFVISYDTLHINNKVIDAFSYYHDKENTLWKNAVDDAKDAVKHYSKWVGDYQYPTVQMVEGPKNNMSGGMEYPTITLITSPDAKPETLDGVITHEVGHNWFMAMLGSNERLHTWMDEGLNSYFEFRYEAEKYRYNSVFGKNIPKQFKEISTENFLAAIYGGIAKIPMKTPIETPSASFKNSDEYAIVSYVKTALWIYLLETQVGRQKMDAAFQHYFNQWNGKHPSPADMQKSFEEILGNDLSSYFKLLQREGQLE